MAMRLRIQRCLTPLIMVTAMRPHQLLIVDMETTLPQLPTVDMDMEMPQL
jgi:hypothetical protein